MENTQKDNGDRHDCIKCPYRRIVDDVKPEGAAMASWHNECDYDGENYTKGTPRCEA